MRNTQLTPGLLLKPGAFEWSLCLSCCFTGGDGIDGGNGVNSGDGGDGGNGVNGGDDGDGVDRGGGGDLF